MRDVVLPGTDERCEACSRLLDCCGNCPKCGTAADRTEGYR